MILLRITPQKSFLKKAPMDFFNYTGKRRKKQPLYQTGSDMLSQKHAIVPPSERDALELGLALSLALPR
jgi:hypothetical protein